MELISLKRSSVHSYLSYTKSIYNLKVKLVCGARPVVPDKEKAVEDLSKPQYYLSIEDRFIDPAKKEIKSNAPIIGDNVYMGPSAKIFGAISTGNNVAIGTNVVMLKDALDNATVVRVPGNALPNKGSCDMMIHGCELRNQRS